MKLHSALIAAFLIFTPNLYAAQYDIKEMTPAIQQALQNRQSRYDQLQQLKSQGIIGENNQGYVEVMKRAALDSDSMASAENQDRGVIYNAIVQQNNLPPAGIRQVQTAFADVQREKARSGDFVQMPSGDWQQK